MARARDTADRPIAAGGPHPRSHFAVAYLNVLIDDADQEELTAALGRIARATGGPRLVEKVELNAGSLYRTLCRRGNPELKSAVTLLKAMGIGLVLQPLVGRTSLGLRRLRRPVRLEKEGVGL
ncbi:MAG TPA: addiction module antidote protein [Steroidobacteraceae bacterium]|nr:addiction module antidote protein [Steroidobacteraceae bacterium]